MTWHSLLVTISKLAELDEFTVETCTSALECNFERTLSNRYCSNALQEPFEYAELILGNDKTILTLTLQANSAREEYAMRMIGLGKPIDIDVVSPPLANESAPKSELGWDRKYSLCYEIGEQPVWFGIEETGASKKLVALSFHRSE